MKISKFKEKPAAVEKILVDCIEAAQLLSISPRKLWSLTNTGEIPSLRIGRSVRYRRDSLDEWTRKRMDGAVVDLKNEEVDDVQH